MPDDVRALDPFGVEQFHTHQLPLDQAPDAYDMFQKKRDGAVKDSDPAELWLASEQGKRKLEWQMERAEGADAQRGVRPRLL